MTRWLSIEATLLSGRYHGKRRDGAEPEWPPAPHRLFQALVAAAHLGTRTHEWSAAKSAAFRWLERRHAPEIIAPTAASCSAYTLSVPNNDMDVIARAWAVGKEPDKKPSQLRTLKPMRPTFINGNGTVRFLWPISDEEWPQAKTHVALLSAEARHLHSLGLGFDLVAGNGRVLNDSDKRSLSGEWWLADAAGRTARTTREGSFDEIVERHSSFLRRVSSGRGAARFVDPLGPPAMVQWVRYRRQTDQRPRIVHSFDLVTPNSAFVSFDPRQTIHVAAWMRHAARESAQRLGLDSEFIERYVCGHGRNELEKNDRLSYLPLPTIAPKGRDGRIRRILLAEPFGQADKRAHAISRFLASAVLVDEDGDIKADLRAVDDEHEDRSASTVFARYLQTSRRWGSVTPVILPGLDDRKSRKAVALLAKALAQAGYTTPVAEIEVQQEPVFPGAELASRYIVPEHLKRWPRVHTIITFAEPLSGPLAIGGGRHSGLGLFSRLD
ncbi:MAG TPA: type I-U CRISPR-associated protein Csb2 [Rhizomicrobium sp.]|jgi:CRISPR-associated protein Csb2|nr:type I-U CRISPR-associated protein Csb2 [Rhizomicrobium sp.]